MPAKLILFLALFLCGVSGAFAQTKPAAKEPADGEMKTYYMAFLKVGQNRSQNSLTATKIQEAHIDT
ncbi:hypothetical protein [Rufibacter tibetensis]|uniref:hypothetical protein n=1 Tax=Rufibacter tibetensis TaxID=512763 RepID=UPI000AB261BB|nr:hypothetical protein [Rufibacter tibetensis]